MHYISAAALVFALGASARPNPHFFSGGFPSYPFSIPALPYGPYSSVVPSGASSSAGPVDSSSFIHSSLSYGTYYGTLAPSGTGSYASVSSAVGASNAASSVAGSSAAESTILASSVAASSVAASSGAAITPPASVGGSSASSGGSLPASSGTSALSAVRTIAAGESFDCGMVMFDRGVDCTGQEEGGDSDAVFILENGASLSNCIIGPNQSEGVHCEGSCKLTNVWWSAVCEDAFTIKIQAADETTTIIGGGAFGAEDKVLQHNGGGTLSVSGFTVDNFGKVYRSCGNCDEMYERHVIMDDITATSGSEIAGINSNYGDTATLTNIKVSDVDDICVTYTGNDTGDEPEENGSGPSQYCIYDESDITEI